MQPYYLFGYNQEGGAGGREGERERKEGGSEKAS